MGALTLAIMLCDTEFDKLQTGMMLAKKSWNTRAPILSAEEMEMLEGMKNELG